MHHQHQHLQFHKNRVSMLLLACIVGDSGVDKVDNVVDEWSDIDERYRYSNANASVKCNSLLMIFLLCGKVAAAAGVVVAIVISI